MPDITLNLPLATTRTTDIEPAKNPRREFIAPIPDEPGAYLLVLDNTSLDKIKRCHVAGRNYLTLGREAQAKNAALVYGGAIHEGFDLFHQWQFAEAHGLPSDHLNAAAQDAAIVQFFTENPPPATSDSFRTLGNALEVMKSYRRRCDTNLHPDYEWEIMSDERGPIIERAFELPLAVYEGEWSYNNETVSKIYLAWSGRIDLIVKANTRIRICDNKTSSVDNPEFVEAFRMASQTIGYNWAAQQMWPGLGVRGFLLNAIYLEGKKAKAASLAGRSISERGPKGGEPALRFDRHYIDYSDDRIEGWKKATIILIEDFLHSVSRNYFPPNDASCINKFGKCPYFDSCSFDNESVGLAYLNSAAFKEVTWNPVTGR